MTPPAVRAPYTLLVGRAEQAAPFVTSYDGPDQCIELSVRSAANNVAKAAGLLRDELGLEPGDRLSIDLPLHWQLPLWTLAGLSVGLECGHRLSGPVSARLVDPAGLAAVVAGADARADELLVSSCDAFGLPVPGGAPPGVTDIGIAARAHPDVLAVDAGALDGAGIVPPEGSVQAWRDLVAEGPPPGPVRTWLADRDGVEPAEILRRAAVDPLLRGGSVVLARALTAPDATRLRAAQGAVETADDS